MQYKSVKLFEWSWSDRNFCHELLAVLPKDAYILARDHPLSEQPIWDDPAGIGIRQANEWAMKVASGNYHLPVERTFFLGKNEPDATSGDRNAIDIYTESFLNRLRVHGLRGGAFNFSTGHPRTVDGTGGTKADYMVFERSHRAIVAGHHIGVLHIYGTASVPCAPGHYDRLRACPWTDVEWVVGECGIDQHVIGGGPHDGYLDALSNPADYCRWLDEFIMGVNDKRIHSYQVFTYDFSHPWDGFNVRVVRDELESYDWQHVQVASTPPVVTHLPAISSGKAAAAFGKTIATNVDANIRQWSSLQAEVLAVAPVGTRFEVIGYNDDWYQVNWPDSNSAAWLHSSVADVVEPQVGEGPVPVDPPTNTGDNWQRSWPIVLKFEGGLSLDPNDTGNYYNGQLIGTKFGISAAVWGGQYDIPNLTQEQALGIYKRHYFDAVGADALFWPLSLAVFDHAINAGVGSAKQLLVQSGPNFLAFMAERITWYTHLSQFNIYGEAWMRRMAEILLEAAK